MSNTKSEKTLKTDKPEKSLTRSGSADKTLKKDKSEKIVKKDKKPVVKSEPEPEKPKV